MGALDARSLAQVADLNEMQAGAGASLLSDWPSLVVKSLSEGFQEWCVLDTLRTYSTETAEMLSEMQDYARTSERLRVEQRDAVHFDFTSQNILVDAGEIAAVIDWEGCLAGDRAFDLATMLFYSYDQPEARARLSERLRDIAVAEVAALYLSHMVVRQLDWSIRKHGATIIEQYLGIARHVLRDLRAI